MAGKESGKEVGVVGVPEGRVAEMIAHAIKGLVTEESVKVLLADLVKVLLADLVKDLVSKEKLEELLKNLATEDRVIELIEESRFVGAEVGTLSAISSETQLPPFDPAWLEGLVFRGAKQTKKVVDGRPKMVPVPFERPLAEDDVLSYSVGEDTVTLVTSDGKKHLVEI